MAPSFHPQRWLLGCCFGAAFPAFAEEPADPVPVVLQVTAAAENQMAQAFRRADLNRDGRLTRAEAVRLPAIDEAFDRLDLDRDGYLSLSEFEQAPQPQ
jgi:Ca2+-binding EF-hand superfamily protein